MLKSILAYLACFIGICGSPDAPGDQSYSNAPAPIELNTLESGNGHAFERALTATFDDSSLSGNYLAGQFAQRHHDWKNAQNFIANVSRALPDDPQLLSRGMILAMGSGQPELSFTYARSAMEKNEDQSLTPLFLAVEALKKQGYNDAKSYIDAVSQGGLSEFIVPLLQSWIKAGLGEHDTANLNSNTIHLYHAVLIADYLGHKEQIETLLKRSLLAQGLTIEDVERIADMYAYIDKGDTALELYKKAFKEWPENTRIGHKINVIEQDLPEPIFASITSPEHGVSEALYDMAALLFRENSDDSARVFANMSLYLAPDPSKAKILMAQIAGRNERPSDAIAYYRSISPTSEDYTKARRLAAELLEVEERDDEALEVLSGLFKEHKDIEALIQIGDIQRRNEDFKQAISTYNKVERELVKSTKGKAIPQEYWHLHYVRGISYEQNNQWRKAEKDLKAALEFKPDHPLVLNYLGYSWADQGINLAQSLDLIKKAATQAETDGYIIDSLGWVLYRMGEYEQAVPHLERAVELLPYDPVINDHLGDAYWQVGRRLEARFQWLRAQNHIDDDEDLKNTIALKLENGLEDVKIVKGAKAVVGTETTGLENEIIEH